MLFIMITGSPPCDQANDNCPRYNLICQGKILDMLASWRNDVPTLTLCAQDLITRILIPDPATMRLRLDEILEHPWVTNLPSLLPMYKSFMRCVQCVRWYESEVVKLRNTNSTDPQVLAEAQGKLEEYGTKINIEKEKQPGLLQAYQDAKLVLVNGGGGGGGGSGGGRRK